MEQARYWMWTKPKPELSPRVSAVSSYGDSWEEQAFAEDAAGALGGCVWPPRSYSCSFCRRDFRSAQALGGHMNVHRRDRARLKQSPNTETEVVPLSHALNPCTSFDAPYSSQICTFLYNNPNPNPNPNLEFSDAGPFASPLSRVIRASSPPAKSHTDEKVTSLHFFFPSVEKTDKGGVVTVDPPSWSSFLSEKRDRASDLVPKKSAAADLDYRVEKEDCVRDDLSMSLNFVVRKGQTNTCSDEEEVASCKRRRVEVEAKRPLTFIAKLGAVDRCIPQSEGLKKLCSSETSEDLDLELRLGDAPKVK